MRLLITRPLPEARRTAALLHARGHDALIAPLLSIEAIPDIDLGSGPWAAILLTSGNAVPAIAGYSQFDRLKALPVFTVGKRTAQAASQAGFRDVTSSDGDGADLARLVSSRLAGAAAPVLYLAGSDRARDLAGDLSAKGIKAETVVVYRATASGTLPEEARAAMASGTVNGALHYSRRTVAIFVECANAAGVAGSIRSLTHYCLSRRAAEPLAAAGATHIIVAEQPDEAALLALIPSP